LILQLDEREGQRAVSAAVSCKIKVVFHDKVTCALVLF